MIDCLTPERKLELEEKYQLAEYQFIALNNLLKLCDLEGKTVLEIGGSNFPRELILGDLGCKKWVSVDVIDQGHYALKRQSNHYALEDIYPLTKAESVFGNDQYLIFNGFAEKITPLFFDKFDVVFSVTCFEHVARLFTVINKAYYSLKNNGVLYSYFGPIWSGRVGHHFWINRELNLNKLDKIPEFAHLLMRPFDLFNFLRPVYNDYICEEIVHQFYFRDYINRLFYEDYEDLMKYSEFNFYKIKPYGSKPVDDKVLLQLKEMYPGRARFDAYGIEITATKSL